jgi:hypothetical protein
MAADLVAHPKMATPLLQLSEWGCLLTNKSLDSFFGKRGLIVNW